MTGGLFEDERVRVPGRVGSALYQQAFPPPAANIIVNNPPLNANPTQEGTLLDHGGGDGGDPWVIVLLGKERSGKSSTGNSIVGDSEAFEIQSSSFYRTKTLEIVDKIIPSIEVPVKVIDTPAYVGDEERNKENNEKLVSLLEQHIHLVHAFVVVVNAEDEDQRETFDMIKEHVRIFGINFLANLVIVVTHWSMSEEASNARQMSGVSREKFTEKWIDELSNTIPLQSEDMIPFVFLDNQVGVVDESYFDETERECFEASKCALFQHLSACPVFFCVGLQEKSHNSQISKMASSKGYKLCSKCNRYFVPVEEVTLTEASSGLAGASQASVAAVRIARVARATSRAWTPQSAMKAMTRGWHGRAGGLHLFGKLVSRAGLAVQVGFGVYRFVNATNPTEKAKAAIGTGAGIIGGWGGATWGASVGTFLLPGIGTILGGIVGGVAGAVGLQAASERCVELFAPDVCFSCKKYEEAQCYCF